MEEINNMYTLLVGKLEGKGPLERSMRKLEAVDLD
jgi:hypothetical protein